jgi:hypothetical protein
LVRKAGRNGVGSRGAARTPELPVVSEILRTAAVRVQVRQKASGSARIVVDVADGKVRDQVIRGIRGAVET